MFYVMICIVIWKLPISGCFKISTHNNRNRLNNAVEKCPWLNKKAEPSHSWRSRPWPPGQQCRWASWTAGWWTASDHRPAAARGYSASHWPSPWSRWRSPKDWSPPAHRKNHMKVNFEEFLKWNRAVWAPRLLLTTETDLTSNHLRIPGKR